jgi:hypothetical protein
MASFRDMRNSLLSNSALPAEFSQSVAQGIAALNQGAAMSAQAVQASQIAQQQQAAQQQAALAQAVQNNPAIAQQVAALTPAANGGGAVMNDVSPVSTTPISSGVASSGSNGIGSNTLISLLTKHEGAGNYDTLFGHSQRNGSRFANVRVSDMSINDVLKFSNPQGEYGNWVKNQLAKSGQHARIATPMGAGQIVGSTLSRAVKQLGIDSNTKFDANTQNNIINYLARQRISNAPNLNAAIGGLRSEWEGFKNVPNATLAQVVRELGGRW